MEIDLVSESGVIQSYSDLLDEAFSLPRGKHFFDDFPIWNPRWNVSSVVRQGFFCNGQLVATASVRWAKLRIAPNRLVKIAIIGGVATSQEWRRKGLASRLIQHLVELSKEKGSTLVLLWSSEHRLYQKLGFGLCGEQLQIPLSQIDFSSLASSADLRVYQGWNPGIFDLLKARSEGLILEDSDRLWFEAHKNVRWFYTVKNERITSFAALGRGIDLHGLVHEWGGDRDSLIRVLSFIHEAFPGISILGSEETFKMIGISYKFRVNADFLGLVKVLDPVSLIKSIDPKLFVTARLDQTLWHLTLRGGEHFQFTEPDLARFILGPKHSSHPLPPLKIWVWGLDAA